MKYKLNEKFEAKSIIVFSRNFEGYSVDEETFVKFGDFKAYNVKGADKLEFVI